MNATKPEKGDNGNSWPHQTFKKGDTEYLARGWDRTAYTKMEGGGSLLDTWKSLIQKSMLTTLTKSLLAMIKSVLVMVNNNNNNKCLNLINILN